MNLFFFAGARFFVPLLFIFAAFFSACRSESTSSSSPTELSLHDRGRQVYMANCVVCHAPNPSKDGSVGPAIEGSSRELIEARVLKAAYPEGYKPKRDSHLMPPMPYLQKDIDALAEFLKKP